MEFGWRADKLEPRLKRGFKESKMVFAEESIARSVKPDHTVRPTWEMAELYPLQGQWTEDDYLALPDDELSVELVQGFLEFLPPKTRSELLIEQYVFHELVQYILERKLGEVYHSGRRVRLNSAQIRLPDMVYVPFSKSGPDDEQYSLGADLVLEIVSGGSKDRVRDTKDKVKAYAKAGIPEYWIVDPKSKEISVLNLKGARYTARRDYKSGEMARSNVLKGFAVDVSQALAGFKFPRA